MHPGRSRLPFPVWHRQTRSPASQETKRYNRHPRPSRAAEPQTDTRFWICSFDNTFFNQAHEPPYVRRLDGSPHRHGQLGTIRVTKDDMAPAGLTIYQPIGLGDRFKTLDAPIQRIGLHPPESLRCPCHETMILPVTLHSKLEFNQCAEAGLEGDPFFRRPQFDLRAGPSRAEISHLARLRSLPERYRAALPDQILDATRRCVAGDAFEQDRSRGVAVELARCL